MTKDLTLPKAGARETSIALVEGIAGGEEEIFPDPMARQMSPVWNSSPKEFERAFAAF